MSVFRNIYQRLYRWGPAFIGLSCILIGIILSSVPEMADSIYRNGLFSVFRWVRDALFNWIPIPLIIVIMVLLMIWLIVGWYRRRIFGFRPWYRGILNVIGIFITWFYLSWGWNYAAPGVVDKLELDLQPLTEAQQLDLIEESSSLSSKYFLRSDTSRFFEKKVTSGELNAIHSSVRNTLRSMGFETPGNVRMRQISSGGWMRKLGIAGIYLPFSGEAHADASYYNLQEWFILAHEYAHGYGITNEGECNFIAFEALRNSGDPEFVFAAWFNLYDDLVSFRDSANAEMHPQLNAYQIRLREDASQYQQFIPGMAEASNDFYLRTQGINEGIESYATWVDMVGLFENQSNTD